MKRRQLATLELPLGMCAAGAVVLARIWAWTGIPTWLPAAPLVRLGVASPLTGMTRSFVAMASGDPARALAWHPLGPALFLACAIAPALAVASLVRGRRFSVVETVMRSGAAWSVTAAIVAAAWVRQMVVL